MKRKYALIFTVILLFVMSAPLYAFNPDDISKGISALFRDLFIFMAFFSVQVLVVSNCTKANIKRTVFIMLLSDSFLIYALTWGWFDPIDTQALFHAVSEYFFIQAFFYLCLKAICDWSLIYLFLKKDKAIIATIYSSLLLSCFLYYFNFTRQAG